MVQLEATNKWNRIENFQFENKTIYESDCFYEWFVLRWFDPCARPINHAKHADWVSESVRPSEWRCCWDVISRLVAGSGRRNWHEQEEFICIQCHSIEWKFHWYRLRLPSPSSSDFLFQFTIRIAKRNEMKRRKIKCILPIWNYAKAHAFLLDFNKVSNSNRIEYSMQIVIVSNLNYKNYSCNLTATCGLFMIAYPINGRRGLA